MISPLLFSQIHPSSCRLCLVDIAPSGSRLPCTDVPPPLSFLDLSHRSTTTVYVSYFPVHTDSESIPKTDRLFFWSTTSAQSGPLLTLLLHAMVSCHRLLILTFYPLPSISHTTTTATRLDLSLHLDFSPHRTTAAADRCPPPSLLYFSRRSLSIPIQTTADAVCRLPPSAVDSRCPHFLSHLQISVFLSHSISRPCQTAAARTASSPPSAKDSSMPPRHQHCSAARLPLSRPDTADCP